MSDQPSSDRAARIMTLLQFARKAGQLVYGHEICKKQMQSGNIFLLLTAQDLSEKTREKMRLAAQEAQKPVRMFATQDEYGRALGLPRTGMIGILDNNFAQKILSYFMH